MRASSGMIGTNRCPISGSFMRLLSRRTNAMVVATGWRPVPRAVTSYAASPGSFSSLARAGDTVLRGRFPPRRRRRSCRYSSSRDPEGSGDVGRKVRVEVAVTERHLQAVAEGPQVLEGELLHLVGGVATLEVGAERPSLDGLGQHDGRLAAMPHGRVVRGIDLPTVVAAAFEAPDLRVGHGVDHGRGARVAGEEVLPDEAAGLRLVGLEVTVGGRVEQIDEGPVVVGRRGAGPTRVPRRP